MAEKDKTKILLEQLVSELNKERTKVLSSRGDSYLIAQHGQFLGKILNKYDNESILNKYGPYGSKYSTTSIFNKYSEYGSKYGSFSLNNPYCSTPPQLLIDGEFVGFVTSNRFVKPTIEAETFLYLLQNDIKTLLQKKFSLKEDDIIANIGDSRIVASDGTFLGKLSNNEFDIDSILNQFGPYGNEFSPKSIFNEFGTYGSEFSALSPFNEFSATPPKVYVNGRFYGYLTRNEMIAGKRIDPNGIKQWIKDNF